MQLKRRLILVALLIVGLAVPLRAQTFTAQIQQFWNLLRTGAISFTTVNAGSQIKMGAGTPDAGHPFSAIFNQNSNVQFLWWNNNAGASAAAEACVKTDTVAGCLSSQGINSGTEPQRSTLYTNAGSGTSGNPGWDIVSCFAATPTLCNTRFFTNTTDGIAGERARIDAVGVKLSNASVLGSAAATGANDVGLSRIGAAQYALGNGTAGDFTGTLKLATVNFANGTSGITSTAGAVQYKSIDGGAYLIESNGQVFINSATLAYGTGGTPDTTFTRVAAGEIQWPGIAFATLGTPANGSMAFCTDCTVANPCAGAGSGALAKRLNGAWVCN